MLFLATDKIIAAAGVAAAEPDRSKFLGGSDAAAVMGLSPWSTPLELWEKKTGRAKPRPVDPVREKVLERGKRLEATIFEMLLDRLREDGLQVEVIATNERYADLHHPFLSCEIDFELRVTGEIQVGDEIIALDGEHINGDCKSVSGFARKKWGVESTEDVPIEYAAQFMHGLGVTCRKYCLVAALMGLDDVRVYWVVANDETIQAMREKCVEFWINHVQADVPPDPINFSDIKALFPLDNGQATEASEEVAEQVAELRAIKTRIKDLEERETTLTFDIGQAISPNAILEFNGVQLATWKAQGSSRLDASALKDDHPDLYEQYVKRSTIRVLRLTKPKA
jgi:putative phage-type endonuclease